MALIYFYDATELDRQQISKGLQNTDHHWEYVDEKISLENLDPESEVISVEGRKVMVHGKICSGATIFAKAECLCITLPDNFSEKQT